MDWTRVAELKTEFGDDGFAEVLDLFLEETDAVAAEISAGISSEEVEGRLHFLKGSALNLGLPVLAHICQDGERLAASARASEVDLLAVLNTYRLAREALVQGLQNRHAA